MLEHTYRIIELKNKDNNKKMLLVDFKDQDYNLLSSFLESELINFKEVILNNLDEALKRNKNKDFSLNKISVSINKKYTILYDNDSLSDDIEFCQIDTKELKELIDEFLLKLDSLNI